MIHRRAIIAGLLAAPFVSRIPGLLMPVRAMEAAPVEIVSRWLTISSASRSLGVTLKVRVVDETGKIRVLSAPMLADAERTAATVPIDRGCRLLGWSLYMPPVSGSAHVLDIRSYA